MRIAVVGAGIVGVTSAYELAVDGHEVTVFERRGSVAEETSFANAGLVAPGYVTPWAAPGMPGKVLRQLFSRHAAIRFAGLPRPGLVRWLWRFWRACEPATYEAHRSSLQQLAHYSQQRLNGLAEELALDFEQGRGLMVLLRTPQDLVRSRPGLKLLATLGVDFRLVDADEARTLEPALSPEIPLRAAVHLPHEQSGNCRLFAQLLKAEAQARGARFVFQRRVRAIEAGPPLRLHHEPIEEDGDPPAQDTFDAVVVCAAVGSRALLKPLGLRLPLQPVYGYSITAPLRRREGEPVPGPKLALMDEHYKVAITRLGDRLRVAGMAELGGDPGTMTDPAMDTLYRVLHDWFPGMVQLQQVQRWKGARPMLPDGPPLIGPAATPGVWLNLGHGSSGWALACGSARALADRIAGREPALDLHGFAPDRPGLR
jgi:D-amino-acid dehydrogenase